MNARHTCEVCHASEWKKCCGELHKMDRVDVWCLVFHEKV